MSTRIGIKLEQDLYEQYKEMLWRKKRTIQEHLEEIIKKEVKEYFKNKEQ